MGDGLAIVDLRFMNFIRASRSRVQLSRDEFGQ